MAEDDSGELILSVYTTLSEQGEEPGCRWSIVPLLDAVQIARVDVSTKDAAEIAKWVNTDRQYGATRRVR